MERRPADVRLGAPAPSVPSGCSGLADARSSLRSDRPTAALRIPGASRGWRQFAGSLFVAGTMLATPAMAALPSKPPSWREVTGPWNGAARLGVGSVDVATDCASVGVPVLVWANVEDDGVDVRVGTDGPIARVGSHVGLPASFRVGVLDGRLLVTWSGADGRTPHGYATCSTEDGVPRWAFVAGDHPAVATSGARGTPLGEEESLEVVQDRGVDLLQHHTPRGTHEVRRARGMLLGRAAAARDARWVPLYENGAARLLRLDLPWSGETPRWHEVAGPWRDASALTVVVPGVAGCGAAGEPVFAWTTSVGTMARMGDVEVHLAGPGGVGLSLAAHGGIVFASWVEAERARVAVCEGRRWTSVGTYEAVAGTPGDPAQARSVDGAVLRVEPTPDGAFALVLGEAATPMTVLRAARPLRLGEPAIVGRDLWLPVFEDGRAHLYVQEAP